MVANDQNIFTGNQKIYIGNIQHFRIRRWAKVTRYTKGNFCFDVYSYDKDGNSNWEGTKFWSGLTSGWEKGTGTDLLNALAQLTRARTRVREHSKGNYDDRALLSQDYRILEEESVSR
jgi:hypothetical protein